MPMLPKSGVSRLAEVVVDARAVCKAVTYAAQDQIYVVLKGKDCTDYPG